MTEEGKLCRSCELRKPISEFYRQSKLPEGRRHICKSCANDLVTDWVKTHKEERRIITAMYRERLRNEVLDAYGSHCACCGETKRHFLTIDHINNDGAEHRRKVGHTYSWLKKNNFPPGFQVLCYNCNCSKGFYGQCPHITERLYEDCT